MGESSSPHQRPAGTLVEAMGGTAAVVALAEAWHARCLADPTLAHAFHGGVHPEHTDRLAAYWCEQLGGPPAYTTVMAGHADVVRMHSGNGPHEQMDGRGVAAFAAALDDVAIPTDPALRFELIAWFTWATALINHHWSDPGDVPASLPMPRWSWGGTDGW